jgi:DNA helicase-2/ATP-dependent DNA helicase PcrA
MDQLFSHLNPEQRKAVLTAQGRVLILAGAGSGKTSVLAYRIAHMLLHLDVAPQSIFGIYFPILSL